MGHSKEQQIDADTLSYVRRHINFGWSSLLCFLTLGIVLEALHGFKVRWYLDVANEARRLQWTLAHAHGVLLGLLQIAFALTLRAFPDRGLRSRRAASVCLLGAGVLLPLGFFLGGLYFYEGDPGVGVLLVPVGAVLLFVAVLLIARGAGSAPRQADGAGESRQSRHKRYSRNSH